MKTQNLIFPFRYVPAPELADGAPSWLHLVPFGAWRGHPAGDFVFNAQLALQVVRNFDADPRLVAIDYEHQTLATEFNGRPAPAAGWIDRLEVRDDGLWGHVNGWTDEAATYLENREYRYLSPVLVWSRKDPQSGQDLGATLHSVALTNTPFFQELQPVVAKDEPASSATPRSAMSPAMLALLGLSVGATETDVVASLTNLKAERDAACERLGLEPDADVDAITACQDGIVVESELAPLLGLEPDATVSAMRSRITQLQAERAEAGAALGLKPDAISVTTIRAAGQAQRTAATDKLLAEARQKGVVTPALESWARRTAQTDPAAFREWMDTAPSAVPLTPTKLPTDDRQPALTDTELAVCRQLGLDPKSYKETRSHG